MFQRLVSIVATVTLLCGCSFFQDWGSIDTAGGDGGLDASLPLDAGVPSDAGSEDGGGVDGGGVDAGPADAGDVDAGTCNDCEMLGCDPTGPRCVEIDGCLQCTFGSEGEVCADDSICEAGLVCEGGFCLQPCNTAAECVSADYGTCVDAARDVCLGQECTPVGDDCGGDICVVAYDVEDMVSIGSICAPATGAELAEGAACEGGGVCEPGHVCTANGRPSGTRICQRWCQISDGCSDPATQTCLPFRPLAAVFEGDELGVCAPAPTECTIDADCGSLAACVDGRCLQECTAAGDCGGGFDRCNTYCLSDCASDADCATGSLCVDFDGDSTTECIFYGP